MIEKIMKHISLKVYLAFEYDSIYFKVVDKNEIKNLKKLNLSGAKVEYMTSN